METIFKLSRQVAPPLMRLSMAVILFWIGALKFYDPSPIVGLLDASLPFFAADGFVYFLGAVEIVLSLCLFAGFQVQYVGLALVGLFGGTLTIFLIAPAVTYGDNGFPYLALIGQFLLKDLVLLAASISLVATASARVPATRTATRRQVEAA